MSSGGTTNVRWWSAMNGQPAASKSPDVFILRVGEAVSFLAGERCSSIDGV